MKVLLTGSEGFIGSAILKLLKEKEYTVWCTDVKPRNDPNFFHGDLLDEAFVKNLIQSIGTCDIIINAASCLHGSDQQLLTINTFTALAVKTIAKSLLCKKLIHLSSAPIIGDPLQIPILENHPVNPKSIYHISKLSQEFILNDLENSSIKVSHLRIPSPIGQGLDPSKFLSVMIKNSLSNMDITLLGAGKRKQNYIDKRDIANAVCLLSQKNLSGIFNLGNTCISNYDLAAFCINLLASKSKIVFSDKPDPEEAFCWDLSTQKAKDAFGFVPQYSLERTILSMVAADE